MALFASDNMVDTNGTLLTAHTGELDNGWSSHPVRSGNGTITGNQAHMHDPGTILNEGIPAGSEYSVRVRMEFQGTVWNGGPVGRYHPTDDSGYGVAHQGGVNNRWVLYRRTSNSFHYLATWNETITDGEVRFATLVITDARKTVLIDDIERMSSTDNTITGSGRSGLWSGSVDSATDGIQFSIFTADTPAGAISVPEAGAFVYDTFTDTPATLLESHTGEMGATWTEHPDLAGTNDPMTISNGDRVFTGLSSKYLASGTATTVEQSIAMTVVRMSDAESQIAMSGWMSPTADTGYHVYAAINDTLTSAIFLYKTINGEGNATLLGRFFIGMPIGKMLNIELALRPGHQTVSLDGVEIITANDTAVPSTNRVGLRGGSQGSDTTGIHVDTFLAWNTGLTEGGFGGGNVFFSDTFTDTDGTLLTNHVPTPVGGD